MPGRKTHEQHIRTLERKSDVPDRRQVEAALKESGGHSRPRMPRQDIRPTEFPVSRAGLNQESRNHNKHNRAGQDGHKSQRHGPAEEKT
ncbi:hypothetical protein AB6806_19860 [Bosea sp. RCC_152_1]|uniref:hypothetical protein n=1 Tax=Bosea sp. RCC_152_1 TaxID=3239228 RepID=UPI003525503F